MTDSEKKNRPLVIYHAHCPDGFCAAWAAKKVHPDAEFVAASHGDPPPAVAGRRVFILDFSYKRPLFESLQAQAAEIVLLDHHKTAYEDLSGLPGVRIELDKSGAKVAWDYFIGSRDYHWLVQYTEDRDLWRWALPKSQEVSAAIASYPKTFAAWDALAARDLSEVMKEGEAILRYKEELVEHYVSGAEEIELDGHKVLAANCGSRNLISDVAGRLAEGRPFGVCWYVYKGKKHFSLRSREGGLDVAEIAQRRGGGGHARAAGFQEE